jgi:hypothetical protein
MTDPRERLKKLVSQEIADTLAELFPDRAPDPEQTDRQIWMDVGSVKVVRAPPAILDEIAEDNLPQAPE